MTEFFMALSGQGAGQFLRIETYFFVIQSANVRSTAVEKSTLNQFSSYNFEFLSTPTK